MGKRNNSTMGRESKPRFVRTGLLSVVVLVMVLSSGCQVAGGAVADIIVRGATRALVRGASRPIVRGAAHIVVRGVAQYVVDSAVDAAVSRSTYRYSNKYLPPVTAPKPRLYQLGFSHAPPPTRGWRLDKKSKTRMTLTKDFMRTSQGIHTFKLTSRIRNRGAFSSDLKELQRQRRDNIIRYVKPERYSGLKVNSAVITLDNAGCVFSRAKSTDTGVPGYEGAKHTLYVDEVICIHPIYPNLLVSVTYIERLPPYGYKTKSPIKHIARSLRFNLMK